jgi:hypothetical protein
VAVTAVMSLMDFGIDHFQKAAAPANSLAFESSAIARFRIIQEFDPFNIHLAQFRCNHYDSSVYQLAN